MNIEEMSYGIQSVFSTASVLINGMLGMIALVMVLMAFFFLKNTSRNRKSPQVSVPAKVLGKRTKHARHRDHLGAVYYYATFEVESGDRIEFYIPMNEYGLLFEGDEGILTFQGTQFKGFSRKKRQTFSE